MQDVNFPRPTVSKDVWHNHIIQKMKQGCELLVWPNRASLRCNALRPTPCKLLVARHIIASGLVEAVAASNGEDEYTRYRLLPGVPGTEMPKDDLEDEDDVLPDEEDSIKTALQEADEGSADEEED